MKKREFLKMVEHSHDEAAAVLQELQAESKEEKTGRRWAPDDNSLF